jgi:2-phosphosulfolactate phosphatase
MAWQTTFVGVAEAGQISGIAVVIDVLRAFTTAAWAFELGVERIVLTDDLAAALRLKASIPGALALKDGEPAPGFDLINSPVMLSHRTDLAGMTIVQRTTHGTRGAVAARGAERLYCASFVCAAATASVIRRDGRRAAGFVVTGDDGRAEEDRACAEYIAALLDDPSVDAGPYVAIAAGSRAGARLLGQAVAGSRGVHEDDVEMCLEANRFDFAMLARDEDGLLVLRRVEEPSP